MAEDAIEVHVDLDGEPHLVGLCRYIAKRHGQSSLFQYVQSWLDHPKVFAIDPANLPLQSAPLYRTSTKSALPGALRDTAPDRWGQRLIGRAFRKSGQTRTLSEIDFLLALNDQTRIGALRYKLVGNEEFDHDIGTFRVPPIIRLPALINAADAIQTNTETADDLRLLLNEGSPLGGARPKSAVIDNDGLLAIAKFPKQDDTRSIPHGEILSMTLAKAAGLRVASASLQKVAGRSVALIRRFDRVDGKRVSFLSALTLLGLDDGAEATYTDIAEIIRMYAQDPIEDLHELWARIIFNVLTSNLDDHLRNHGFLYVGQGKWQLSPAYDLNPVPLEEKARELTTWISEEGPDASIELALSAAHYFALKQHDANAIVKRVSNAVSGWRKVATRQGMSAADIATYSSAFS